MLAQIPTCVLQSAETKCVKSRPSCGVCVINWMNIALSEPPAIAKGDKNSPLAEVGAMPHNLDANTGTH